jgi:hypothetical protein
LTGLELHGKEDKQSRLKGLSNLGAEEGDKPIFPDEYANRRGNSKGNKEMLGATVQTGG